MSDYEEVDVTPVFTLGLVVGVVLGAIASVATLALAQWAGLMHCA